MPLNALTRALGHPERSAFAHAASLPAASKRLNRLALMAPSQKQVGFTLIELMSVLIIVSVLAVTGLTKLMPTSLFELQAARSQLVLALGQAQQKALFHPAPIRLSSLSNTLDIRQDLNGDGLFQANESIRWGAVQYPLSLVNRVQVSSHTLDYSSLGDVTPTVITLSKAGKTLSVTVSASGWVE